MIRLLQLVSLFIVVAVFSLGGGCDRTAEKEMRDFKNLEAAIGLVSNAAPADRGIRLEQLQNLRISSERVKALKTLCVSSYTAFDKASDLLEKAKAETGETEAEMIKLRDKKLSGADISPDEEARLIGLGKQAAASIQKVTAELDKAEQLVATCEKKRLAMRAEMLAR